MGGLGDKLEGKAEEVKGDVKEKVGDATDNRSLQAEGVGDQASGEAKQAIGEAKDALNDVDDDRGSDAAGPESGARRSAVRLSSGQAGRSASGAGQPIPLEMCSMIAVVETDGVRGR